MRGSYLREWLKESRGIILFSVLHTIVLVVLTFWWMQLPWQFGDELIVARINQVARYLVIKESNPATDSLKKQLLLINCSYDKMLIPYSDDFGEGNKAVVDRTKLQHFFKLINTAPHKPKMVVVDIYFDYPSQHDSLLFEEMKDMRQTVFSSFTEKSGQVSQPVPGLNYALAQYKSTDMFLKYSVTSPSGKYVPAAMYEITSGETMKPWWGLVRSTSGTWLNTFTVDMAVRRAQIAEEGLVIWNLGEALNNFSTEEIQQALEGKIVVLGDFFEYDIHETLLGPQPGPLIMVNAYHSMLLGVSIISFLDVSLLFLLYFFTTLYILSKQANQEHKLIVRAQKWKAGRFVIKYLSYLFIFSIFTILFYMLTLKHFQLVLFAFYFNLFEFGAQKYRDWRSAKLSVKDTEVAQHEASIPVE